MLSDKSLTFATSDPNVITIKEGEAVSDGNFTLVTHNPGNAVLTIYNANEAIVYRQVIRVRPAIAPEDMDEYLFNVDAYQSIMASFLMANYELTFTSVSSGEEPATGILVGSDEVDANARHEFSYVYDSYIEDRDCYQFNITTIQTNVSTELVCFQVAATGDMMMVYYDSGDGYGSLLTIMVPTDLLYLHS